MQQTPAHERHNPDLLSFIPRDAKFIVEVGCSSGALAREYKKLNLLDHRYIGIEIDPEFAKLAERHCDEVFLGNIENINESLWERFSHADCWIFGDTLEHLQDPWKILKKIRESMASHGNIVCCVPNSQHWSLQVKMAIGDLRYQKSGLLDITHLRFFTRQTLLELFVNTGFEVKNIHPRIFNEVRRDEFLPTIKELAKKAGVNPDAAGADAIALQYVILAKPSQNP
jgi:SAM-dependent methyltransferase